MRRTDLGATNHSAQIEQYYSFVGESAKILTVCQIVKTKISSASQLFFPSDPGYNQTIQHFISSSTTRSICSVEPGTVEDVATIVSNTRSIHQKYFLHILIEKSFISLKVRFSCHRQLKICRMEWGPSNYLKLLYL